VEVLRPYVDCVEWPLVVRADLLDGGVDGPALLDGESHGWLLELFGAPPLADRVLGEERRAGEVMVPVDPTTLVALEPGTMGTEGQEIG